MWQRQPVQSITDILKHTCERLYPLAEEKKITIHLLIAVIFFVLCFIFNRLFLVLEKKLAAKKDYVLAVEYIDDGQ